ncbi:hypothetical protein BBOV_II002470 [Babesia bovis T2Bo]|uniref:Uncharacterized protein n=1 Tax=Babesia bovis TaxID=5865 RepID=A7ATE2_BABBO|nr:hypothetical protein BBOV_II002470 [Babesia bovis T2Bo]EDO06203.1 hypothetical protein BBOV_II002470 [Babesia bovis T2Bo]|eukprot:XP_001609771.1 hypothetical protein [Babesia bovis T2Bo]
MELQITGPYNKLSTEDLEILDDVVQSFCEAVDVVLKTNFKSQKKDTNQIESISRNLGTRPDGITKNQKIAAVFCRQWIAGVVSELTYKLANDTSERFSSGNNTIVSAQLFDEDNNSDEVGLCVENARICGNGQIEVDYDYQTKELPPHLKPKLKAQELTQLILQGKQNEYDLMQKLERFWSEVPSLLCQYLTMENDTDEDEYNPENATRHSGSPPEQSTNLPQNHTYIPGSIQKQIDNPLDEVGQPKLPIDPDSIQFLEKLAKGDITKKINNDYELDDDESIQQKLEQLEIKAKELGVKGMDKYIALYNKVNKEINKVNKAAKFFAKFATDLTSNNQIDIM